MTTETPADAVREALEVMETRWGGYANAKETIRQHIASLESRLAALAGAAPVACVSPEMVAQLEAQIEALRKADAARDDRLRFLTHAPAKAREDEI